MSIKTLSALTYMSLSAGFNGSIRYLADTVKTLAFPMVEQLTSSVRSAILPEWPTSSTKSQVATKSPLYPEQHKEILDIISDELDDLLILLRIENRGMRLTDSIFMIETTKLPSPYFTRILEPGEFNPGEIFILQHSPCTRQHPLLCLFKVLDDSHLEWIDIKGQPASTFECSWDSIVDYYPHMRGLELDIDDDGSIKLVDISTYHQKYFDFVNNILPRMSDYEKREIESALSKKVTGQRRGNREPETGYL